MILKIIGIIAIVWFGFALISSLTLMCLAAQ